MKFQSGRFNDVGGYIRINKVGYISKMMIMCFALNVSDASNLSSITWDMLPKTFILILNNSESYFKRKTKG